MSPEMDNVPNHRVMADDPLSHGGLTFTRWSLTFHRLRALASHLILVTAVTCKRARPAIFPPRSPNTPSVNTPSQPICLCSPKVRAAAGGDWSPFSKITLFVSMLIHRNEKNPCGIYPRRRLGQNLGEQMGLSVLGQAFFISHQQI